MQGRSSYPSRLMGERPSSATGLSGSNPGKWHMDEMQWKCEISDEDLRAALKEMKTYVDITEDDLKRIYTIALRHAEQRISRRVFVRDAMTRNVIKIKADADFNEVTNLLSEHRISGLPVVDEDDRVIGVITEADVLSMASASTSRGAILSRET
jgi:CBS-domain-containing membrane protein